MSRVQAGDPDAAAKPVRHYEPVIRPNVRVPLRIQDGRVRRMLASMDATQSVLASFFASVANRNLLGEFRNRLSVEERQLIDLRGAGQPWTAIREMPIDGHFTLALSASTARRSRLLPTCRTGSTT
jgi:hypothetical protein